MTNEAFELYFKHLKPNGVLAFHISNRYVNLVPVCARAAEHVGKPARVVLSVSDGMFDTSVWVLVTANRYRLRSSRFAVHRSAPNVVIDPDHPASEFGPVTRR